jgi:DNA invertase Pin-like site-specific DNA recombinase
VSPPAVAYRRVSTTEQGEYGVGLEAQRATILDAATMRGLEVVAEFHDVETGSGRRKLPGRQAAIEACLDLDATLVVAKWDRLSRNLRDGLGIIDQARAGLSVLVLDFAVDLTTPQGRLVAHQLLAFAEFERDLISQRTRDGLAVRRAMVARGESWVKRDGTIATRVGRPPSMSPEVHARAAAMLRDGKTRREVAAQLNAEGVPTPLGGRLWRASSLEAVKA